MNAGKPFKAKVLSLAVLALLSAGCKQDQVRQGHYPGAPMGKEREMDVNPRLKAVLNRLHGDARGELLTILLGLSRGIFRSLKPEDMKDAYMAVDRDQGTWMYDVALERKAVNIIEFGTSFGISTLYLAAAAKRTGGKVITAEILPAKVKAARRNFQDAGLQDYIEVREGDAMITLKDVPPDIDFVLFDAWSDLYIPLLRQLLPRMKDGCVLVTDNTNFAGTRKFVDYLRAHKNFDSKAAPVSNMEVAVFRRRGD